MPPHNRKLGLIGISLTKVRTNKNNLKAFAIVRDEIEAAIINSGYLVGAPFEWVTIAIRYGLIDASEPIYQRISKKYHDLPLSIEVNTERLIGISLEELVPIFKKAVLIALIDAGKTYARPIKALEVFLNGEL